MKIVDCAAMAEIDRQAQKRFFIPHSVLMEDAALGIYHCLRKRIWKGRRPRGFLLFLVGKGNNGGDALVVARQCRFAGIQSMGIVLGAGEPNPDSLPAVHLKICRALGIEVVDYGKAKSKAHKMIDSADWLIDGLLGTGLTGRIRSPLADLVQRANRCSCTKIAVDIPSGVGDAYREGYPAVQGDHTLTVQLPKLCLYLPRARKFCGRIHVIPGVFPGQLANSADIPGQMIIPQLKQRLIRPLAPDTHKGRRGHLAVFAGSKGTTGAAWLCSTAAARSRAGLVTVYVDSELYADSIARFKSVMVRPWGGEEPELSRYSALLVGPGWGLNEQRQETLKLLLKSKIPGVLDADGISLLARLKSDDTWRLENSWVLTPHPGELARLLGTDTGTLLDDPLPLVVKESADLEAVIVLKGHCTYVVSPDGSYGVLDGMNPALATGGSGDVLAGMIAGLLASGFGSEQAARLAVLLHSEIGKKLYRRTGTFLAEDMIPFISKMYR